VLAFARAYVRGIARFKADKDLAIKAYQKYLQIDDQAVLADTWDQFRQYLDLPPVVTTAGLENAINAAADTVPEAKGSSPEKYVDNSFIQQLQSSGFFNKLP
jgi:hypothetical protein